MKILHLLGKISHGSGCVTCLVIFLDDKVAADWDTLIDMVFWRVIQNFLGVSFVFELSHFAISLVI